MDLIATTKGTSCAFNPGATVVLPAPKPEGFPFDLRFGRNCNTRWAEISHPARILHDNPMGASSSVSERLADPSFGARPVSRHSFPGEH